MIYEMSRYTVKPGVIENELEKFGAGYDTRKDIHPLAAFWVTETGPLNQIIQVWPWDDMAHREAVRAEVNKLSTWPPGLGDAVTSQNVEMFNAFPFADKMRPGNPGPVYEMRIDQYGPGKLRAVRGAWEKVIADNEDVPIVSVMATDLGALNKLVHVWAFESLGQRSEVLGGPAGKIWSADALFDEGTAPERQYSNLMRASAFSPMQ